MSINVNAISIIKSLNYFRSRIYNHRFLEPHSNSLTGDETDRQDSEQGAQVTLEKTAQRVRSQSLLQSLHSF